MRMLSKHLLLFAASSLVLGLTLGFASHADRHDDPGDQCPLCLNLGQGAPLPDQVDPAPATIQVAQPPPLLVTRPTASAVDEKRGRAPPQLDV